jgi:hypothetical protein
MKEKSAMMSDRQFAIVAAPGKNLSWYFQQALFLLLRKVWCVAAGHPAGTLILQAATVLRRSGAR